MPSAVPPKRMGGRTGHRRRRRRQCSHGTHRAPAPMPSAVPPKRMGGRTGHCRRRRRQSSHGTHGAPAPMPSAVPPKRMGGRTGHRRRRRRQSSHGTHRAPAPMPSSVPPKSMGGRTGHRRRRCRLSKNGTHRAPSPALSSAWPNASGHVRGTVVGAVGRPRTGRTGRRRQCCRQSCPKVWEDAQGTVAGAVGSPRTGRTGRLRVTGIGGRSTGGGTKLLRGTRCKCARKTRGSVVRWTRRNEPVLRRRSSTGKMRPIGCETPDASTDRGLHCHGMSSLIEVHKRSCVFKLHYQFLKRGVACCIVVGGATRQRRTALQHMDTLWPSAPQRLEHSTPSLSLPIPSLPHCLLCVCFPTFVRSCGVPVHVCNTIRLFLILLSFLNHDVRLAGRSSAA